MTSEDPRREQALAQPPREPRPDSAAEPTGDPTDDSTRDPTGELPAAPTAELAAEPPAAPTPWRSVERSGWPEPVETRSDRVQEPVRPRRRRNRAVLGIVSFTLAALLLAANIVGTVLSNTGESRELALGIAFATIFGTILTFLGGLIAAALNFGRGWGVAAMGFSVLGNPFVLVVLFGLFTGALRP